MSILAWIEDQKRLKLLNAPKYVNPAADSSKGLWTRCDKCGVILYIKHLKENQRVCFGCSYHLQMSSQERVENLLDPDSWRPLDETVSPCDPLEFHDQKDYTDRLQEAQERTGLQDAIQTGSGMVDGIPVAFGVMDFDFMGGSMGSVVGEKVTRLIEYATQEGLTLILVCASGGARMQEGVFSLMQMAKISSALQVYQTCANLLYISILTSPTTGGVTASFAMLGDIIFAEPKALIAFAGRRVIEQTLCEDLPEDFQTSEYMLHHGLLDLIVPRRFLRQALSESIRLYKNAPFKKPGRIPFGVQNPITFLGEERIRRRWSDNNICVAKGSSERSHEAPLEEEIADIDTSTLIPSSFQKDDTRTKVHKASSKSELKQSDSIVASKDAKVFKRDSQSAENSLTGGLTQMSNLTNSALERNNANYRDILTSFQTMFHLFSKKLALPYPVRAGATTLKSGQMAFGNSLPKIKSFEILERQREAFLESLDRREEAFPKTLDRREEGFEETLERQREAFLESLDRREEGPQKLSAPKLFTKGKELGEENILQHPSQKLDFRNPTENSNKITKDEINESTETDFLLQSFMTLSENQSAVEIGDTSTKKPFSSSVDNTLNGTKQSEFKDNKNDSLNITQENKIESNPLLPPIPEKFIQSVSVKDQQLKERFGESESCDTSIKSSEKNPELIDSCAIYNDFLNQSIELAATECVEWRAFYVHQRISPTTGFLEDFVRSFSEQSDNYENTLQNSLFYRSICRKIH